MGQLDGDDLLRRLLILLLLLITWNPTIVSSQIIESIDEKVGEAYLAINEASSKGGDVIELVESLNLILEDINSGEFNNQDILDLLNSIIASAKDIEETSIQGNNFRTSIVALNSIIVLSLCYVTWRFFPIIYWRLWLRFRGHWRVE
jgi:hypothetical protein